MNTRPRFAALVTLHETQEREARRRLGELERRRADLTTRIDALIAERHRAATQVDLAGRDQLARYWSVIENQVLMLREGFKRLEQEIAVAQGQLTEAHRAHALFLKLQERDAAKQLRRDERRAQRRLEEHAARRFHERANTAAISPEETMR